MPRKSAPPRLWKRPAGKDRASVYIILDAGRQVSTGCGSDDDEGAKRFFAEYLGRAFITAKRVKERAASEVKIAEVVANYLALRGRALARPICGAGVTMERVMLSSAKEGQPTPRKHSASLSQQRYPTPDFGLRNTRRCGTPWRHG